MWPSDAGPHAHRADSRAVAVGLWLCAGITVSGVAYAVGLAWAAASGNLSPAAFSSAAQAAVGFATLLLAQVLLAAFICIGLVLSPDARLSSHLSAAFAACFTVAVSINRFVQLAVVRPGQAIGEIEHLTPFLPHDPDSVMFALEVLGWGIFLGLAMLALAPAFRGSRLAYGIRWSCVVYGVLSLTGAAGYVFRSPWFLAGFAAWGLVLYVWSGLLVVWFWQQAHPAE